LIFIIREEGRNVFIGKIFGFINLDLKYEDVLLEFEFELEEENLFDILQKISLSLRCVSRIIFIIKEGT
jgi:hypothetical protein